MHARQMVPVAQTALVFSGGASWLLSGVPLYGVSLAAIGLVSAVAIIAWQTRRTNKRRDSEEVRQLVRSELIVLTAVPAVMAVALLLLKLLGRL